MRARSAWGLAALLCAALPPAALEAERFDDAVAFPLFTGLLNVPSAEVTPDGRLDPAISNYLDPHLPDDHEDPRSFGFSLGVFPHVEIGGRVADSTRMLDLSGNVKLQIPRLPAWAPSVALGVQDFAGEAQKFESRYAVASYALGPVRASLGYGLGPDRMRGVFGGAEWSVGGGLTVLGDYDADEIHVGARYVSPEYRGARAVLFGQIAPRRPGEVEVALGVQVPLWRSGARADEPVALPADIAAKTPSTKTPSRDRAELEWSLRFLKRDLIAAGFERVRVGLFDGGALTVEYENHRFRANEIDALGVLLGIVAAGAPEGIDRFVIESRVHRIPVLRVRGRVADYREFLAGRRDDPALSIREAGARERIHASDIAADMRAERVWARVDLHPITRHFIATELGPFDLALSLGADLSVPLWPGAVASAGFALPVARTEAFAAGGPFSPLRPDSGLRDAMLHQTWRLAPGLLTTASAGLYRSAYVGALSDTIWSPGRGDHLFRLRAGQFFARRAGDVDRPVWLGTYRYDVAPLDVAVEATIGRFWHRDRGWRFDLWRRFDDVAIALFYKYNSGHAAGARISLPLTARRELRPGPVHLRGPDRKSAGLQTSLLRDDGTNRVTPGITEIPELRHDPQRVYRNHDRLSASYIERHAWRLRDAYRRYAPAHPFH